MAVTTTGNRAGSTHTLLGALRVTSVLAVLSVAFQFVTAGQLFPRGGPEEVHAGGAIVLHVVSALTTVAAFLYYRATRGPLWPTILSAVVLVAGFVQAYIGDEGVMSVHVPLAMLLTLGAVWVLVWAVGPAVRRR